VLERCCGMPGTEDYYWEHVLMAMLNGDAKKRMNAYFGHIPELDLCAKPEMYINRQPQDNVYEFENLEELRQFDPKYLEDSGSEAMRLVSAVFGVPESEVRNIRRLKAGMTNNSWLFTIGEKSYICRIPGEGTEKLINRYQEAKVYEAIGSLQIAEKIIYLNENTGYKISEFYENSRNSDMKNETDLRYCMQKLKILHGSGLRVEHEFNIEKMIHFYEDLVGEVMFEDYPEICRRRDELLRWLDRHKKPQVLAHIDPVNDNFIFLPGADISEKERDLDRIRLIDWEYAGMCDPMIDLGMCAIYSYMEEEQTEKLMEFYFERPALPEERQLVYAYMALGGLLWALWGLYKESLGIQFSDYTIKMYRYFKKYSAYVINR
jgi:thiamine kinase-like enzyme